MDLLSAAREHLSRDYHSLSDEWEALTSLAHSEPERVILLKWVFAESPAYWATRATAGELLLQDDENETWKIIERLVDSSDPDDNGTVLTLFERLGDPRGLEFARRWLTEKTHPSTQLDATVYLKEAYPEHVRQRLEALTLHDNQNIQRRARELLAEFESR
ncbi:MAG: hypothetical protein ACRDIB_11840 [Ardenticatenaceae bacterium]